MPGRVKFRIAHVSGEDDDCSVVELTRPSPTTEGWRSSRFCLYPQDIIVQLDRRMRIRTFQLIIHQYLIPTKIEFEVGDVPDSAQPSVHNASYTKLGFVLLSNNEKNGFKNREMKNVHVDANGIFVKLIIHKNHVNKFNMFNQVGIVGFNILGDELNKESDYAYGAVGLDHITISAIKPDISALDDLSFDMNQDPEVAQIIQKLDKKKHDAVLEERYDNAETLKHAIRHLVKLGEKLGKIDVEKRQAVLNEDYDKAKLKKVQMDEYRLQVYLQLQIHNLLEIGGSRHADQVSSEALRVTPPAILPELLARSLPVVPFPRAITPPRTPYDERPLPAIKNGSNHDDHDKQDDDDTDDGTDKPEPMSEEDSWDARTAIELFGLLTVTKAYSRTWTFREAGLLEVYQLLHERASKSTPRDEARSLMRAAILPLTVKGIRDKVNAVLMAAISLLRMILTEFIPNRKGTKSDVAYAVEKTLPSLLQRTGDMQARVHDAAKKFILEESQFPNVRQLRIVPAECVKPFKLAIAWRLALSRVEVVYELYAVLGIDDSGLSVENLMNFCTTALQHSSGKVREKAELLIIDLYKDLGAPVKKFLPPDDDITRRNMLYKQLFQAFDKIDGKPCKDARQKQKIETAFAKIDKPTKEEIRKQKIEAAFDTIECKPSKEEIRKQKIEADIEKERQKEKEIEELQHKLELLQVRKSEKLRLMAEAVKDDRKKEKKNGKPSPNKAGTTIKADAAEEDDTLSLIDHTCIFCGEKNEEFDERGLGLHYWRSCPMLKRCLICRQVLEVSRFTEHRLTVCKGKSNFKKCPRCTEAVHTTWFYKHRNNPNDNPAEKGKSHCPLCHENFPKGEDQWKAHLMGTDGHKGCEHNPRRFGDEAD